MAHEVDTGFNLKIISLFQLAKLQRKQKTSSRKVSEYFRQLPTEENRCYLYQKGVLTPVELDTRCSDHHIRCQSRRTLDVSAMKGLCG